MKANWFEVEKEQAEREAVYLAEFAEYAKLPGAERRFAMRACFGEKTEKTEIDQIYFLHDTWAFSRIYVLRPKVVVDVGSRALLVGLLACLVPTISVDIRPLPLAIGQLSRVNGSITDLPFADESIELLNCLSVIEHIGLGRYGDKLDPLGSFKAFAEVTRVVKKGGHFILAVPVGAKAACLFNAHRIFVIEEVKAALSEFAIAGQLWINPDKEGCKRIEDLKEFQEWIWCADLVKQ